MEVIWVRHGETAFNSRGRYLGHKDIPLNEQGLRQAELTAGRLGQLPVQAIYSSDLLRCRQTAEIIARERGIKPKYNPALRELNFGRWEGLSYDEALAVNPHLLRAWYDNPFHVSPPEGETLKELGCRLEQWLQQITAAEKVRRVICISHGGILRYFQSYILRRDPACFWRVPTVKPAEFIISYWNGRQWFQQSQEKYHV